MSNNLHLLKSSPKLKPFAAQIQAEFNNFNQKIKNIFPKQDIDIVVYDNPNGTIPNQGIGGFTPYPYLIFISFNPNFSDFKESISKYFSRVLAHEIYHAIRSKYINSENNLLESLVTEGLADHFDLEINHGKPQEWDIVLNQKQIDQFKQQATKEFFNKNYNHNDWFFGSQNIPKWTGYTLGFILVKKFLENHPDQKPSALFNIKAKNFI